MRLRRSVADEEGCGVADVVLQLGESKISLKAERLLGAAVRVSGNPDREQLAQHPAERLQSLDEEKAIEAVTRMQAALASGTTASGKWTPWSPDDLYPYERQPYPSGPSPHQTNTSHIPELSAEETVNAPAYYNPAELPNYVQQTSTSAIRDMALQKGAPTIFDNLGEPVTPSKPLAQCTSMKQPHVSRRSKTFGHGSRPRKLDLVQLFPTRPTTGRPQSPSRISPSPSASIDRTDYPLPPLPTQGAHRGSRRSNTTAGGAGKNKMFDEDIFDQHKITVRRPPKGIQNWFDAYLESDDEAGEDDIEEKDEEVERGTRRHVIEPQPEPQELPADDISPPAYSGPMGDMSRISEKSEFRSLSVGPILDVRHPAERFAEQEELQRYRDTSESNSWDSIQSSHIGRIPLNEPHANPETNTLAGQSVLSLSESLYEDEDEEEDEEEEEDHDEYADEYEEDEDEDEDDEHLATIRDSIWEDQSMVVKSASSIGVQKVKRPPRLHNMKSHANHSRESIQSSRSSKGAPSTKKRAKSYPTPPPTRDTNKALRKLNGLSSESQTSTSGGETALQDPANAFPAEAAHVMAVTDEEKMVLDLMRRKRAAMQQMSFTEGYQMALKSEQQRLAKRTASAETTALKALRRREFQRRDSQMSSAPSPTRSSSEADVRRQLSILRKEQVDESFQIERFLGIPITEDGPVELPNNRSSAELLPATVYSPTTTPSGNSPANTHGSFPSSEEQDTLEDVQKKVKYFIAANGAVPPLHMAFRTMRRNTTRQASSMPPSPVVEEEQQSPHTPPEIPLRSPERHRRVTSGSTINELHHKISSVSMDDEPRDKSPICPPLQHQHYMSRTQSSPVLTSSSPSCSPFSQLIYSAATKSRDGESSRLPPTSSPRHVKNVASQGSAGEDVLAAWADLGGERQLVKKGRRKPSVS